MSQLYGKAWYHPEVVVWKETWPGVWFEVWSEQNLSSGQYYSISSTDCIVPEDMNDKYLEFLYWMTQQTFHNYSIDAAEVGSRSSEIRVLSFQVSHNEVDDSSDRSFHQKASLRVTVSLYTLTIFAGYLDFCWKSICLWCLGNSLQGSVMIVKLFSTYPRR